MNLQKIFLILVSLHAGCGGSTSVSVRTEISGNETANPLQRIAADMVSNPPTSRGVYFQFHELSCIPKSINDVISPDTPSLSIPDPARGEIGSDPLKNTYTLDTSELKENSVYRVTMVALNTDGTTPFQGIADCPLNLATAKQNRITLCFGSSNLAQVCPQTMSFSNCPKVQCTP